MAELQSIADIPKLETARQRRGVRKGRITRLKRQLEEFQHTRLQGLHAHQLAQLTEDLKREQQFFTALQYRYEQLLEQQTGVTEDQVIKEMEDGMEAADKHHQLIRTTELLNAAHQHYLKAQSFQTEHDRFIETADSSLDEFETDCKALQAKISTFQRSIASFNVEELQTIRDNFSDHEKNLARKLTESRHCK